MKKILALAFTLALTVFCIAGCGSTKGNETQDADSETITIGASATPHAEILKQCVDIVAEEGYTLEIKEFSDYVLPNTALQDGDLDANYFQHEPYLITSNADYNLDLVSAVKIHYEPFGIYAGKTESLAELKDGASIGVPNDGSNETRALLLLQQEGVIKLKEGIDASSNATKLDIAENPLNVEITEMEAAQLAMSLKDMDLAVINGNYALQADLNASTDALAIEDASGDAAQTYANILAVKAGNEDSAPIRALIKALTSDQVKEYIQTNYEGAVVPIF